MDTLTNIAPANTGVPPPEDVSSLPPVKTVVSHAENLTISLSERARHQLTPEGANELNAVLAEYYQQIFASARSEAARQQVSDGLLMLEPQHIRRAVRLSTSRHKASWMHLILRMGELASFGAAGLFLHGLVTSEEHVRFFAFGTIAALILFVICNTLANTTD